VEDISRNKCFLFFRFEYHMLYVLYPFVTYSLTLLRRKALPRFESGTSRIQALSLYQPTRSLNGDQNGHDTRRHNPRRNRQRPLSWLERQAFQFQQRRVTSQHSEGDTEGKTRTPEEAKPRRQYRSFLQEEKREHAIVE
jgi:hypothetical protein